MAKKTHKMKEEWKVYNNVFDNFTINHIFKLQSEGFFKGLESPIMLGKEANIFSAIKNDGKKVIVKIYRLQNCNFNKMYEYIKLDSRYQKLKKKRREIIFAWVQREYRNLLIAREAQVKVPLPHTVKDNIIVMEYIGDEEGIAPQLKDAEPDDINTFFDKTIDYINKLYKKGIVHGDLSPFNILNFNETPVFIDMSQGTDIKNPQAIELLIRDIKNVCVYFRKIGMKITEEQEIEIKNKIVENK